MKEKMTISSIKHISAPILKRAGMKEASIFGSFARGDAHDKSDVDFLVTPPANFGLLELVQLHGDLKDALRRDVDIITRRSINQLIKKSVLAHTVRII